MDAMRKVNKSGLPLPVGARENPIIIIDGGDDDPRTGQFKFAKTYDSATRKTKRQPVAKPLSVVIDLTFDTPTDPHQLLDLDAADRKRSHSEMAEIGDFQGQSKGEVSQPCVPKCHRPYIKRPLPRFPRLRIVYEQDKEGRVLRKRAFGNFPHTRPEPSLQASWEAHVRRRSKRPATTKMSSGREQMRQEMNAEEDLSLSQGDVSKRGSTLRCYLPVSKSTYL